MVKIQINRPNKITYSSGKAAGYYIFLLLGAGRGRNTCKSAHSDSRCYIGGEIMAHKDTDVKKVIRNTTTYKYLPREGKIKFYS